MNVFRLFLAVLALALPFQAMAQVKPYDGGMSCRLTGNSYDTTIDRLVTSSVLESDNEDQVVSSGSIAWTIQRLIEGNCGEPEFIKEFLKAADFEVTRRMGDMKAIWREDTPLLPYGVFINPMRLPLDLHLLGYPDALKAATETLVESRKNGESQAAVALHMLSIGATENLLYLEEDRAGNIQRLVQQFPLIDFTTYADGFQKYKSNGLPRDRGIRAWVKEFAASSPEYVRRLADQGSVLAAQQYIKGEWAVFEVCAAPQAARLSRIANKDSLIDAFEATIENTFVNNRRYGISMGTQLGAANNLSIAAFDILTDCAFSGNNGTLQSSGIKDMNRAYQFALLAGTAPEGASFSYVFRHPQAANMAVAIENSFDDAEHHYAAARLLISSLGNVFDRQKRDEELTRLASLFSKDTIKEAQMELEKFGLYSSGIDGIVGSGFRKGIQDLDCLGSKMEELCLDYVARRDAWLSPYLPISY